MNSELINVVNDIKEEMKQVYLHDDRPWIIGYSGGKDSTTVVQLAYEMLLELEPSQRKKTVFIVSSDTLIENPIVLGYLESSSKLIGEQAKLNNLPIETHIIHPEYSDSFWTNLIGKGLPTPTSIRFRWCTERLKIKPSDYFAEKAIEEYGEVLFLLGVRKAESSARKRRIENREIDGYLLTPHSTINHAYVYNPIVELTTDNVWEILLNNNGITPWGSSNNDLFDLYLGADSGECPFTITHDEKGRISNPSCGNSRFGCWICTVVNEDKSLTGFIENGEEYLQPLLDFRNWLLSIRDKYEYRSKYRRDGNHYYKKVHLKSLHLLEGNKLNYDYIFKDEFDNMYVDLKNSKQDYESGNTRVSTDKDKVALELLPLIQNGEDDYIDPSKIYKDDAGEEFVHILGFGPFNFKARKLILKELLKVQHQYQQDGYEFDLIKLEELQEIDKIWDKEEDLTRRCLVDIYYEVTGEHLPWDAYKRPLYDENTLLEIEQLAEEFDLRMDLVNRLLIETNNVKYYSNKSKLDNTIKKVLQQKHWHQSLTQEIEYDNQ